MRIPEIREEMLATASEIAPWAYGISLMLHKWEKELHRRTPVRRAASCVTSRPEPTAIIRHALAYPDASYMEIAEQFGCSIGRVSEALAGFRK